MSTITKDIINEKITNKRDTGSITPVSLGGVLCDMLDTSASGTTGPQGERGPQGPEGPQGDPGPQGLQGLRGQRGQEGPAGADGKDGTNGKDGVGVSAVTTASTSEGVITTITLTNGTSTEFTLTNGPKGAQGAQGAKGDPGETYTCLYALTDFTEWQYFESSALTLQNITIPNVAPTMVSFNYNVDNDAKVARDCDNNSLIANDPGILYMQEIKTGEFVFYFRYVEFIEESTTDLEQLYVDSGFEISKIIDGIQRVTDNDSATQNLGNVDQNWFSYGTVIPTDLGLCNFVAGNTLYSVNNTYVDPNNSYYWINGNYAPEYYDFLNQIVNVCGVCPRYSKSGTLTNLLIHKIVNGTREPYPFLLQLGVYKPITGEMDINSYLCY